MRVVAYQGHTDFLRRLRVFFVQDVEALKSVQRQLETFKSEMERDGVAQRGECRKVVAGAIRRAQKLIDSTLQVCLTLRLEVTFIQMGRLVSTPRLGVTFCHVVNI